MRVGRLDDARKAFDNAAKGLDRDLGLEMLDGAIWVAQGDRARSAGDDNAAMAAYEKAIPLYQKAKQLGPNVPAGFVQDAMLKRKMYEVTGDKRRLDEALASADRSVAVGAAYFPSCAVRAEVLVAQGDVNGAVAELERYLAILPASVDGRRRLVDLLIRTGRTEQAEAALMAAIGIAPGEPAWHFALGEMLSRAGRMPEAARAFERADTLQQDAPTFYRELEARMRARDYTGVIDSGRRRGDFVRTDNTARTYVGLALIGRGDRTEGMRTVSETYKEARTAADGGDGQPMFAWFTAFRVLLAPQQIAEAEELIKQVSGGNLSAYDRDYLASLAMMNPSAGPAKAVELLAPVETADYSKNPALGSMILDRLGTAYYMAGDCNKAIGAFENAMKLTPEADGILNNFAYLCGECLKDPKRGMPAARRAVQIQPTRAEYLDTLATLLLADNNPREALETLDRAAKIQDSGPVQYHRAQALSSLGRKEEARAAVQAGLGMPNLDGPTKQGLEKLQGELK
jgi:tetratricopeptide (TPR) repeat protein